MAEIFLKSAVRTIYSSKNLALNEDQIAAG